mmetsp:Transcript_1651/g.3875  ORF Transcript_1651/g.3875 Transcript_1651/m.3875 type:complete len:689 (+) Transcript_1651:82-2148(+)
MPLEPPSSTGAATSPSGLQHLGVRQDSAGFLRRTRPGSAQSPTTPRVASASGERTSVVTSPTGYRKFDEEDISRSDPRVESSSLAHLALAPAASNNREENHGLANPSPQTSATILHDNNDKTNCTPRMKELSIRGAPPWLRRERDLEQESHRPWLTSGELFYRGGFEGSLYCKEWYETFANQEFQNFLKDGLTDVDATRRHDATDDDLRTVQDSVKRLHEQRMRKLAARLRHVEGSVEAALGKFETLHDISRARTEDHLAIVDQKLLSLCALYAANIEKECAIISSNMAWKDREHKQLLEERQHTLALEEFGLHLSHETEGRINMRRLPPDNPQYQRCKRATSENIKGDFFGKSSNYSGIKVLEVFKIENRPMLREFQHHASSFKPGSVKGLFCAVPQNCLPRLAVEGMGRAQTSEDVEEVLASTFLRAHTVALEPGSASIPGIAESQYLDSLSVEFPKQFSRYSTMEEFRSMMSEKIQSESLQSSDETNGPSNGGNQARYLALCRVIIGNAFMTSGEYEGFPKVDKSTGNKFDSIFSPALDEYLILHGTHVLPEFLIRYEFNPRFKPESPQLQTETLSSLEPDFSTAQVSLQLNEILHMGEDLSTLFRANLMPVMPKSVAMPNFQSSERNHPSRSSQRKKASKFTHAAEVQAGRETLHFNAARQRDEIWAALSNVLRQEEPDSDEED